MASTKNFNQGKAAKSNSFSVNKIAINTKATFTKLFNNSMVASNCFGLSSKANMYLAVLLFSSRNDSVSESRCEKNAFSELEQMAETRRQTNKINM